MYGADSRRLQEPTISEPQNKAFAGVGMPINDVVCRSSRLNLAKRNAEKAAITKATNGKKPRHDSIMWGYSITLSS